MITTIVGVIIGAPLGMVFAMYLRGESPINNCFDKLKKLIFRKELKKIKALQSENFDLTQDNKELRLALGMSPRRRMLPERSRSSSSYKPVVHRTGNSNKQRSYNGPLLGKSAGSTSSGMMPFVVMLGLTTIAAAMVASNNRCDATDDPPDDPDDKEKPRLYH